MKNSPVGRPSRLRGQGASFQALWTSAASACRGHAPLPPVPTRYVALTRSVEVPHSHPILASE